MCLAQPVCKAGCRSRLQKDSQKCADARVVQGQHGIFRSDARRRLQDPQARQRRAPSGIATWATDAVTRMPSRKDSGQPPELFSSSALPVRHTRRASMPVARSQRKKLGRRRTSLTQPVHPVTETPTNRALRWRVRHVHAMTIDRLPLTASGCPPNIELSVMGLGARACKMITGSGSSACGVARVLPRLASDRVWR